MKLHKKGVEWTLTKVVVLVILLIFIIIMIFFSGQVRDKILRIISEVF